LQVIKDKQIVEDSWQRLIEVDDDQALPVGDLPEGDIIVPFKYWQAHQQALQERAGKLAVCLDGDDETEEVAKQSAQFELIALNFPAFTDGRSYSHARLLRERYGYQGELRAVGDVLRDQLFFMQRCGIDSYQLREDKDIEDALNAFDEFSVKYQTAADGAEPIYKYR